MIAALCFASACSSSTSPSTTVGKQIFVSLGSIGTIVRATLQSRTVASLDTVIGRICLFCGVSGVARDSRGRLYAAIGIKVFIYAAGSTSQSAPIDSIGGPSSGMQAPWGIAMDHGGSLYVSGLTSAGPDAWTYTIFVFSPNASGDAIPSAIIRGANTGMNLPLGIAVDDVGNIFVANDGGFVTEYAAGATGNVAPLRTIAGAATGLVHPDGVALDPEGRIVVTDYAQNSVSVFAKNANGNAAPLATISGAGTGIQGPLGVVTDADGNIYVASSGNGALLVFASGASGAASPKDSVTLAGGPLGLTF